MDVEFGGRYYQAYLDPDGNAITFCGDEPFGNPSVIRNLPGSSCETCMHRVGAGVERVVSFLEAKPLRHLVDAPWDSIAFTPCSRFGGSNLAGICAHYYRDEKVLIQN